MTYQSFVFFSVPRKISVTLFYLKALNGSKITEKSAEAGEISQCNFPKTISSVFYLCLKHSGKIVENIFEQLIHQTSRLKDPSHSFNQLYKESHWSAKCRLMSVRYEHVMLFSRIYQKDNSIILHHCFPFQQLQKTGGQLRLHLLFQKQPPEVFFEKSCS